MNELCGAIEAGGTKFVCAVGAGPGDLRDETRIETTTPPETLGRAIAFFRRRHAETPLAGIGIGSFGPADLDESSSTYGFITNTPKAGWAHVDFAGAVRRGLNLPVAFDTDVNAAATGEHRWGAARGLGTFVYLTIGTGIGGGAMAGGRLVHGMLHPEMGHMRVPHDRAADPFPGVCPVHGDCLEGLASGPAMERRWGQKAQALPESHAAWALEAEYLAQALANLVCVLSPQRIILGGGVMQQAWLLALIRQRLGTLLNGYIRAREIVERMDEYVVPPGLGSRSGILGALALVQDRLGSG
ncbi:MAG: ROK family protein [Lentisphaerae bacterium]|nr:ROK family protein [Lentisphaerota bacterium]